MSKITKNMYFYTSNLPSSKKRLKASIYTFVKYFIIVTIFQVILGFILGFDAIILSLAFQLLMSISILKGILKYDAVFLLISVHIFGNQLFLKFLRKDELNTLQTKIEDVEITYTRATMGLWQITGIVLEDNEGNRLFEQPIIKIYWPKKYCKELVHWWEENKKHLENEMGGNGKGGNQRK